MSLAEQSQQWYPTSVQVTVHQARNLRIKGKNGTNDAYAIMQVAKDKFSTSVAEKCVSPVWKEEALFDLPLFHHGNAERCTLHVAVNHRALVGLDKLLGQAVVNLLELHDKKSRNKTEWFKLLDKNGKADKDRGEVLLDVQFMRNNVTASMFDLSMQDKPRSRIGKLKDKIRGKKKDGFSDSASAVVPSVAQVLTDSEAEGDARAPSPKVKRKLKVKSLFAPKSNLQRNVSQSMSTLGSLPEKDSGLTGSRSSGLNVDSPEVKKKFKFLTHKRTGSADSRASQGPLPPPARSKPGIAAEPNSLCINGSHVYAEATAGSSLSPSGSAQGSLEDLHPVPGRSNSDASVDSLRGLSLPSYRAEARERALLEQRSREEEEEEEERRRAEAVRLQEERALEEEARKRLQEEEVREAEERRVQEGALKRQEEGSVGDRLSSLFGIVRRKEEQPKREDKPAPPPPHPASPNPFEEIPLSPGTAGPSEEEGSPVGHQRGGGVRSPQSPSGAFHTRTAKVSAVKPRLESEKAETDKSEPPSPPVDADILAKPPRPSSPSSSSSSLSSVPSHTPDMFSSMHTSMAPPKARRSGVESLGGSTEDLSDAGSSTSSADRKRRAPLPPRYQASPSAPARAETHNQPSRLPKPAARSVSAATPTVAGYLHPIDEADGVEDAGSRNSQKKKTPVLPLPDYDTLYPKKIHGLQGQMRWDHIVAEVTQRQRDYGPELTGREVSVDRPSRSSQDTRASARDPALDARPAGNLEQTGPEARKRTGSSSKQVAAPVKPATAAPAMQGPGARPAPPAIDKPNRFALRVLGAPTPKVQNASVPQVRPRLLAGDEKVLNTSVNVVASGGREVLPRERPTPGERPDNRSKEVPAVKPRQRPVSKERASAGPRESPATILGAPHQDEDEGPSTDSFVQANSGRVVAPVENPTPAFAQAAVREEEDTWVPVSKTSVNRDLGEAPRVNDGSLVAARGGETFVNEESLPPPSIGAVVESSSVSNRHILEEKEKVEEEASDLFREKVEVDPFPSELILPDDPWALSEPGFGGDDLFTGGPKRKEKPEDLGMTTDDIEKLFVPNDDGGAFSYFDSGNSASNWPERDAPLENSPDSQKALSTKKGRAPAPPRKPDRAPSGAGEQRQVVDPFSFPSPSPPTTAGPPTSREPPKDGAEDVPPQSGGTSWGKAPLRAWVSPSEAQPIAVQSGGGGGAALGKGGEPVSAPRRPHPVKPMSSLESQAPTSTSVGRDLKSSVILENVPEKMKVPGSMDSGPYAQLTREELASLVARQQAELAKKSGKILELEEYIDNLLVRVIEEQPGILLAMSAAKTFDSSA